ncbi:unnamed protein product [Larinioides sclopetarius]|jgi:hypothetical protein
MKQ